MLLTRYAFDSIRYFLNYYNFPFRTPLCNKRAKNITDSKCDTLGLTELGTMCNFSSHCAVVRDNGFATAFTIAHEIAHL